MLRRWPPPTAGRAAKRAGRILKATRTPTASAENQAAGVSPASPGPIETIPRPPSSHSTNSTRCRIKRRRSVSAPPGRLGNSAGLLCHHYQRADVYQHADPTGDSLKLSRLARRPIPNSSSSAACVFHGGSGRHHVGADADKPSPDLAAGCSMADMANLAKVERCWRELNEVLGAPTSWSRRSPTSTPPPT